MTKKYLLASFVFCFYVSTYGALMQYQDKNLSPFFSEYHSLKEKKFHNILFLQNDIYVKKTIYNVEYEEQANVEELNNIKSNCQSLIYFLHQLDQKTSTLTHPLHQKIRDIITDEISKLEDRMQITLSRFKSRMEKAP
jgi:hypothetical protein